MGMDIYVVVELEDEEAEASMVMDFSGVTDFENKQIKMDIIMNVVEVPGEDEITMEMEMYLTNDMM